MPGPDTVASLAARASNTAQELAELVERVHLAAADGDERDGLLPAIPGAPFQCPACSATATAFLRDITHEHDLFGFRGEAPATVYVDAAEEPDYEGESLLRFRCDNVQSNGGVCGAEWLAACAVEYCDSEADFLARVNPAPPAPPPPIVFEKHQFLLMADALDLLKNPEAEALATRLRAEAFK